jgi:hypothetical protein
MSKINREIIDKILTHNQIESVKKDLQNTMFYDKTEKISIKYNENVNPEIDYDVVEAVLEFIIDKALKLKDKRIKEVEITNKGGNK